MRIIERIDELRSAVRELRSQAGMKNNQVGFVPTMGYLHRGHVSLLKQAKADNGIVVLSIFVNPMQFGPSEDFDRYPRDPERDLQNAREAGVDIVFMPSVREMYPNYPLALKVTVGEAAERLCGASRPGHFDGVATVVLKLFQIVQPDRAYFGMKDAQQVAVIKQLVRDFNVPVDIVACPTEREPDGLALSSRNVYLSDAERRQAVILSRALDAASRIMEEGETDAVQLEESLKRVIDEMPLAVIDYVSVLSYPSLQPLESGISINKALGKTGDKEIIAALAVKFGRTRLIDNRIFTISEVCSYV